MMTDRKPGNGEKGCQERVSFTSFWELQAARDTGVRQLADESNGEAKISYLKVAASFSLS